MKRTEVRSSLRHCPASRISVYSNCPGRAMTEKVGFVGSNRHRFKKTCSPPAAGLCRRPLDTAGKQEAMHEVAWQQGEKPDQKSHRQ